jgi:hypothetical protein
MRTRHCQLELSSLVFLLGNKDEEELFVKEKNARKLWR